MLEDGNSGKGVLPEHEEILIGRSSVAAFPRERLGPRQIELRECADGKIQHDAAVAEDGLECRQGRFSSLPVSICPYDFSLTI